MREALSSTQLHWTCVRVPSADSLQQIARDTMKRPDIPKEGPLRAGAAFGHAFECNGPLPAVAAAGDVPVVVAFSSTWHADPGGSDALRRIRAELRGLGAVLVVFSDEGTWSFRPDDEMETASPQAGDELARAIAFFGVERTSSGRLPFAVFVLDHDGSVRFSETRESRDEALPQQLLLDALSLAGHATTSRAVSPTMFSRREVVITSLVAGFLLSFGVGCDRPRSDASRPATPVATDEHEVDVVLHINGKDHKLRIDPRVSLLDALRERLGLTGTKKGCDHGQCGACTVLIDERRVCSCLTLAIAVASGGSSVTTIEGLADGDKLHPMQQAFASKDAFQCGYCTPGQILSAVALLKEGRARTDDEVRESMSGNLCRCGAYPNIVAAIQHVRETT